MRQEDGRARGRAGRTRGGFLSQVAASRRCRPAFLLAGIAALAGATARPAAAQTDPRLVEAVRTAQEGSSDSARAVVRRLLAATPPTDSLYPEILYTQAMVAGEAGEMRRQLQRVAVEYAASSWADDALLRLAQMDYASRSLDAAARNLEKLRSDYPLTPLLSQAAYWAGRTYFDLKNDALACRWISDGMARAQDVEVQNQLGYLFQRCGTAEAAGTAADSGRPAGDSAGPPATPAPTAPAAGAPAPTAPAQPAPTPAPPAPSGGAERRDSLPRTTDSAPPRPAPAPAPAPPATRARFRVQVSAVATPGAADDAASKVETLGYPALIVRERGLYKVRAGEFMTREEAQAAVPKLKRAMGGSPFIVAEP